MNCQLLSTYVYLSYVMSSRPSLLRLGLLHMFDSLGFGRASE